MSEPVAVLISDVHYSVPNLALADAAMLQAINRANELKVPLIVAGDLHDTKANLRAECVNAMIETLKLATFAYVLIGNHDKINEKSEGHSLNFLSTLENVLVVDKPYTISDGLTLIPYQHDLTELCEYLKTLKEGTKIIMHQGLRGSDSGEYIDDKTAIEHEDVKDFRVISGHYHKRQDIKTGRPRKGAVGLFSYLGNPFTTNFAEASDPEKGFNILMDNGLLEFVPTNLRKHIKWDLIIDAWGFTLDARTGMYVLPEQNDLLAITYKGTREQLTKVTRDWVKKQFNLKVPFRLNLVPTDAESDLTQVKQTSKGPELFTELIKTLPDTTDERKERLLNIFRGIE